MADNKDLTNVKIKYSENTFYESSKEKKSDAYKPFQYTDSQTKELKTVYHRHLKWISGKLVYLGLVQFERGGKFLSMILSNEDGESFSILQPIYQKDSSSPTDSYFNSFVSNLQNVEKGDQISITVNDRSKDKRGEYYKNVIIFDEDRKLIKSPFSFKDVPSWEKSESTDDFGNPKIEWDFSEANKFYIDLFNKLRERLEKPKEDTSGTTTTVQESKPKKEEEVPLDTDSDEYDDLPF